jgi:sugar/nucleoside kinase (ribokinase family)
VSCDGISEAAAAADAVVFGTLGCRAPATRAAVRAAAAAARYSVCDVNLRPPFVDEAIVAEAASGVDLLKLNDEELLPLAKALRSQADGDDDDVLAADAAYEAALRVDGQEAADDDDDDSGASTALIAEAAAAIGKAARASSVVVTRGAAGAVVWESGAGNAWSCGGFSPPTVVDTAR